MTFVALFLGGFLGSFVAQLSGPAIARLRTRRSFKAATKKAAAESDPDRFVGRVVGVSSDGSIVLQMGTPQEVFRIATTAAEALEDCDCPICRSAREQEAFRKGRMS